MKKLTKRENGFTLIEVLIVVIIIAILATLGIARFLGARADAEEGVCDSNQASLNAAIQAWRLKNPGIEVDLQANPPVPTIQQIKDTAGGEVECPSGGDYTYAATGEEVTCDYELGTVGKQHLGIEHVAIPVPAP